MRRLKAWRAEIVPCVYCPQEKVGPGASKVGGLIAGPASGTWGEGYELRPAQIDNPIPTHKFRGPTEHRSRSGKRNFVLSVTFGETGPG